MLIFPYPFVLTYVLVVQKNRLIETVLLSTHNICFGGEIGKLVFNYTLLSCGLAVLTKYFPKINPWSFSFFSTEKRQLSLFFNENLVLSGDTPIQNPQSMQGRSQRLYHVEAQEQIGGPEPPLKNEKNIGFLSNAGPDPLKNHKATKPAFNVEPSWACQRNAI